MTADCSGRYPGCNSFLRVSSIEHGFPTICEGSRHRGIRRADSRDRSIVWRRDFPLVQRCLKEQARLFVTHRRSIILYATGILVIGQGRIIDDGTHMEFMHRCVLYDEMYTSQAYKYLRVEEINVVDSDSSLGNQD